MEAITYKGWTIQEDPENWTDRFILFPTAEGIQHDADCDENGWHYCGNCKWADTIEDAKDLISEKIMTELPAWRVETFNPLNGGQIITKFWHIVDAVVFASKRNGNLLNIESI
jgi:hypothetical protein